MGSGAKLIDLARGRAGTIGAVLVVLGFLVAGLLVQRCTPTPVRSLLGLLAVDPPMYPEFADLRSVTHRWDCVRAGVDVYRHPQCDPWGRAFNYPPVWLLPAFLGLGASATVAIGLLEAALMLGALAALFPHRTAKTQITIFLVAVSTPVVFAIERGNVDILIFVAIVAAFFATRDLTPARRDVARFAVLTALTWMKLFPIAGAAHLARSPRRALVAIAGAVAVATPLALVYGDVLPRLAANTVHELVDNYGRLALFLHAPDASDRTGPAGRTSLLVALAAAIAGAACGAVRAPAWLAQLPNLLEGAYETDLAAVGVAIYMLTFLVGLNFDYRLIFLILIFPALIRYDGARWTGAAGQMHLLLLARLFLAHRVPDRLNAMFDWILFSGAAAWIGASAHRAFAPQTVFYRTAGFQLALR